jgi:hypothetical protein
MKPDFPIFKPRYPLRTRLVMLLPTVIFFGMLCNVAISFAKFSIAFWVLALAIGLLISLIPFFVIREVRFPNEMVVRRHFLPDRFFSYKEFEQIDGKFIQAGGQLIRMGQLDNLDELKEMSQRWKAAKILKESRHAKPETESPYLQRGYGAYASFWGLMFGIIVMLMLPPQLGLDPRWVLGGTFLLVYLVYIYIVPKYL